MDQGKKFTTRIKGFINGIGIHRPLKYQDTDDGQSGMRNDVKNKKLRDEEFRKEDIREGLEENEESQREATGVMEGLEKRGEEFPEIYSSRESEGQAEANFLKQRQGGENILINDETIFSDGSRGDGTKETTEEELKILDEIQEQKEIAGEKEDKENRQRKDFYSDRGRMGARGEGHVPFK
jgi:hypothetical protein